MYCKKCGAASNNGAKFCMYCGKTLSQTRIHPLIIVVIVIIGLATAVLLLAVAEPLIDKVDYLITLYDNSYVYHGDLAELLKEKPTALTTYTKNRQKLITDDYIVEQEYGINDSLTAIRYKYRLIESYDRFEKYKFCAIDRKTGQDYLFEYEYDIYIWLNW